MPTSTIPPFLQTGCPSCRPTNSVKALKATTHSLTYHVFARVVFHCLPYGFRFPSLHRFSSDLTVFSQQPASDADSACPACEMLPSYSYLAALPQKVCDLTQPLPFLWPAGKPFVCIIHLKAATVLSHNVDALALARDSEDFFFGGGRGISISIGQMPLL